MQCGNVVMDQFLCVTQWAGTHVCAADVWCLHALWSFCGRVWVLQTCTMYVLQTCACMWRTGSGVPWLDFMWVLQVQTPVRCWPAAPSAQAFPVVCFVSHCLSILFPSRSPFSLQSHLLPSFWVCALTADVIVRWSLPIGEGKLGWSPEATVVVEHLCSIFKGWLCSFLSPKTHLQ